MKQFVKALGKQSDGFKYPKSKFPKLSQAKVKAGIFIGPWIRELAANIFAEKLTIEQKA